MSKIYLVVSCVGEWECYVETVKKAFKDFNKAVAFMSELEAEEIEQRDCSHKCRECNGYDKTCPLYEDPDFKEDPCQAWNPWHDNVEYRIDEVELVE